ncbi:MAG: rhodanese-like domain-containing protein [Gammaproteobacteria bacterium]|nr:rhodanese-like domain-containing protein [Gammaproteobacteria bacterium]
MKLKIGYQELVKRAEAEIETLSVDTAIKRSTDPNVVIVDIRDVRELQREGRIPGSLHMPRCMLEFWIDPESPYHKPIFASGKEFIFHCSKGWRSALATQTAQMMGLPNVSHIGGGLEAWVAANGPVEKVEAK